MDSAETAQLARLLRGQRVAALGTLRQGAPNVSLVSYLAEADFGALVLRVSRLAWHTQDMLQEPRVSLVVAEPDDARADPQTLARVTLRGTAAQQPGEGGDFERLKRAWLERFPQSAVTFELADFAFWRIAPRDARFVAGLGRTYNLSAEALRQAAN
ncbi:MAG TPA: pyridoxamine 5'-phosphate oxidase family protein [Burkholderiales bacterium]|nr:pyridoxamine 5'-phosphate oxidase family protein [Burkholderiales bacterium]